jgi:hypothetical protein
LQRLSHYRPISQHRPKSRRQDVASYVSTTRGLAPAQFAAIAIYVAVLAPQFPALVARGFIISAPQVAPQLVAIVSDFGFIVPDVAAQTSVTIPGKRRRHTHTNQQENSSNRSFHIFLRPQTAVIACKPLAEGRVAVGKSRDVSVAGNFFQGTDIVA